MSGSLDIGDQYRLVAKSPPETAPDRAISSTRTRPERSAFVVPSGSGAVEGTVRAGQVGESLVRHLAIATAITFLGLFATACGSTPSSSSLPDASNGQFDASACGPSGCDDGVACTVDRCESGRCVHTPDSSRCPVGHTCDMRGCTAARPCAVDRDCGDQDPCTVQERCDPATRVCVTRQLDGDGDGHAPRSCGGNDCNDNDPAISPTTPERCNNLDENCNGQVDEDADGSCSPGTFCRAGQCTCRMTCGPVCSDPMTDRNNCGQCGMRCGDGMICAGGRCTCSELTPDLCGEACRTLQGDNQNCGACGFSCASGVGLLGLERSCVAGVCQCPPSYTTCTVNGRSTCTKLDLSALHCGECGRACPVPANGMATCNRGTCGIECSEGYYARGSECVRAVCDGFRGRCDPLNDLGCDPDAHCSVVRGSGSFPQYECQVGEPGSRAISEVCSSSRPCQRGLVCLYIDERSEGFCEMPCCGPGDTRCGALVCEPHRTFPAPYGHFCRRRD